MHYEARQFLDFVSRALPDFFSKKTVLDVGSGDINGNNHHYFRDCDYHGNDLAPGPGVTVVSRTSQLPFEPETFDTVVSSECFEHDPEYQLSLQKIVSILKPGGMFLFTCASTGRAEHGTRKTTPGDSFATRAGVEVWSDYYKNLTMEDVRDAIALDELFGKFASYYNSISHDLYFVGVKRSLRETELSLPDYQAPGVRFLGGK